MREDAVVVGRRALLSREIESQGLSVVAKKAGKPDRQINDMAAGRKPFGDRISKQIGPLIRPDLPRDWLIYPEDWQPLPLPDTKLDVVPPTVTKLKPPTERETWMSELVALSEDLDTYRLGMLIKTARDLVAEQPARQTPTSSP